MAKILNTSIKNRKDTTANWSSNNPILKDGEIGFEETTDGDVKLKVGDGSTNWNSLNYFTVGLKAYKQTFTTSNFTSSSGSYTLSIPYSTHKISNIGFVVSYQLVGSNYCTCLCDYQFDSNNNVKILSSNSYNGMVIIFGV